MLHANVKPSMVYAYRYMHTSIHTLSLPAWLHINAHRCTYLFETEVMCGHRSPRGSERNALNVCDIDKVTGNGAVNITFRWLLLCICIQSIWMLELVYVDTHEILSWIISAYTMCMDMWASIHVHTHANIKVNSSTRVCIITSYIRCMDLCVLYT